MTAGWIANPEEDLKGTAPRSTMSESNAVSIMNLIESSGIPVPVNRGFNRGVVRRGVCDRGKRGTCRGSRTEKCE